MNWGKHAYLATKKKIRKSSLILCLFTWNFAGELLKGFVWFPVCICWQVCPGLIRRWTNDILYINLSVLLYRIWTQQRINSKMTYRCKNLKIQPELPRNFSKIPQSPEMIVCLQIVVHMYLSVSMQRELSLKFNRNNVYGHLEQVSRTCVYFHFQITQLVLQTCSKCPYTLFLWKFNDSSLCIGNERCICTTICKHTMNSGLCRIFGKFRGNSG